MSGLTDMDIDYKAASESWKEQYRKALIDIKAYKYDADFYKDSSESWKKRYEEVRQDLADCHERINDLKELADDLGEKRDAAILKAEKLEQQPQLPLAKESSIPLEDLRRAQTSQTNQD